MAAQAASLPRAVGDPGRLAGCTYGPTPLSEWRGSSSSSAEGTHAPCSCSSSPFCRDTTLWLPRPPEPVRRSGPRLPASLPPRGLHSPHWLSIALASLAEPRHVLGAAGCGEEAAWDRAERSRQRHRHHRDAGKRPLGLVPGGRAKGGSPGDGGRWRGAVRRLEKGTEQRPPEEQQDEQEAAWEGVEAGRAHPAGWRACEDLRPLRAGGGAAVGEDLLG